MIHFNTVSEAILFHSANTPEKTALIFNDSSISYTELKLNSEKMLSLFHDLGIKKGDCIAYSLFPSPLFFQIYIAAGLGGICLAGIGTYSPSEAITNIINEVEPKLVVCDDALKENFIAICGKEAHVISAGEIQNLAFKCDPCAKYEGSEEDALFILYTSGTTKKPKGAVLSHKNVLASCEMQNNNMFDGGFTSSDSIQHYYPLNHVSGAVECGVAPLIAGGTIVVLSKFNPKEALRLISKYKVSTMCGVPAMWSMLFEEMKKNSYDISSVRVCISGASLLSEKMLSSIKKLCSHVENPLGMTETSGFCSGYPNKTHKETVGKIHSLLEYKIIDNDGKTVPKGTAGELCYKGPSVIKKYTNSALPLTEDGFFKSGDMGFEDEDGCIHLCGRNDDMFTVGGYNVFPQEIEDVLLSCPGIKNAAVLPVPHKTMGNVCRAYITVCPDIDADSIISFVKDKLPSFKVPRDIVIREVLPVNTLGKISKTTLSEEIKKEFSCR